MTNVIALQSFICCKSLASIIISIGKNHFLHFSVLLLFDKKKTYIIKYFFKRYNQGINVVSSSKKKTRHPPAHFVILVSYCFHDR